MKQEAERGVERHPRQIEEGDRASALQERPDLIKVTAGQGAAGLVHDRNPYPRLICPPAERPVEVVADPGHEPGSGAVDGRQKHEQGGRENRQTDQCRHAATRKNPVVYLQHEERSGQHKNIGHAADQGGAHER
jgi:hypothetical protein